MRWRHLRRPDAEQTYTAQYTASVAEEIGKDERMLEERAGRRWRTEVTLKTNAKGRVQWRGCPGWYEVRAVGQKPVIAKPVW